MRSDNIRKASYKPDHRIPRHPNGKLMYIGENPRYDVVKGVMVKIAKGIPFRKTDPITGEIPEDTQNAT